MVVTGQAFSQRGVPVSFRHPIADFGHPNIHICLCIMQWDEKELDTQFTPNVYFWTPNSEILAKALFTGYMLHLLAEIQKVQNPTTVEPRYIEVLGTMKITLLYQVSHYIRVKKTKKYKELGPAKLPCYNRVLLYPTSL